MTKREKYIRNEAITCIELLKGFDRVTNEQKTIEDLSGYILELTNKEEKRFGKRKNNTEE